MEDNKLKILVVDDEKLYRLSLINILNEYGRVFEADSKESAINLINENFFDIAFIDIKLNNAFVGLDIIDHAARNNIYSVVLSAYDDDKIIENAYQKGCQDFFEKGNEDKSIKEVFDKFYIQKEQYKFKEIIEKRFITQDPQTIDSLEIAFKNNTGQTPIFISGPTGVGKTTLAKVIHEYSRREGEFIQVNCSDINPNLIESELFGHKKGSFTGAFTDKVGRLKCANGGTLFLDEICSIPLNVQAKLLKVIEEKTFYPVGSNKLEHSNFALISASQEAIFDKIQKNEFRSDLYYRISGINLHLKGLRERPNDIPLIIKRLLKDKRKIVIKPEAMELLKEYEWPGNIRELLRTVEILEMQKKGVITKKDLPQFITHPCASSFDDFSISEQQLKYVSKNGLKDFINTIEKDIINKTLQRNNQSVVQTIHNLKISRTKFYTLLNG